MSASGIRCLLRRTILIWFHQTQSSGLQPVIEFRHEIPVAGGDSRCCWLGSLDCLLGSNDQGDEAISLPGHGLYESRGLGVTLQGLTKLTDRAPDTVVGVQESTIAPNPGNDLIPGNNLVSVFKQEEKPSPNLIGCSALAGSEAMAHTLLKRNDLTPHRQRRHKCKPHLYLERHKT